MTSNFNPDTGLRIHDIHMSVGYDLSLRGHSSADHTGVDGQPFDQSGYTTRIPPHEWHTMTVLEFMQRVHDAHHDGFGLNRPADKPLYLHPQGDPGQTPQPVTEGAPPDYEEHLTRLIAHVTAAKQDELNAHRSPGTPAVALDPTQHPASPSPAVAAVAAPPAPPIVFPPRPSRRPISRSEEGR